MYEVDEVTEFVDGGRKQLKISPRPNPVQVLGGTWKLFLDHGTEELTEHLLQGRLSAKEVGIFLHLVSRMGVGNTVVMAQRPLADRLGVSVSYVSRVLGKLKALGLLRDGMLSPLVVTKCRTEDYPPLLAAWHKLGDMPSTQDFGTAPKGEA